MNTGFAIKLNNDHGFSPDGNLLAISDKSKTAASCIYVMPVGGGHPVSGRVERWGGHANVRAQRMPSPPAEPP